MRKLIKITPDFFCEITGVNKSDLNANFIKKVIETNLSFNYVDINEEEKFITAYKNLIHNDNLKRSGPHRKNDWDYGWNENLEIYKNYSSESSLIPKYVKKLKLFRIKGRLAESINEDFEYQLSKLHHQAIALKFFQKCDFIYEFGCGTGINLLSFNEILPLKNYIGLDWVESSKFIIDEIKKNNNINIKFEHYDFFQPHQILLNKSSGLCTIASLEQVGENFQDFIDVLVRMNPKIIVHIEPILDWYDIDNPLEFYSIEYHNRRGYLKGLLKYLEDLEQNNIITILKKFKTQFGEYRHNPYSLIVWRPN